MTVLAIIVLLFGIFLVSDGAFTRGLLITILPDTGTAAAGTIRIAEVVAGGLIFLLLGLLLSPC